MKADRSNADTVTLNDGKWYGKYPMPVNYAEDNEIPIVGTWSQKDSDCKYCARFSAATSTTTFKNWMKNSYVVFMMTKEGDAIGGVAEGTAWYWSYGPGQELYPITRVYWKKDGKVLVNKYLGGGMAGSRYENDPERNANDLITYLENALSSYDWAPEPEYKYEGWYFSTSDRLEVDVTAIGIWLPVKRTETGAAKCTLVCSLTGAVSTETVIDIAAGETTGNVWVSLSSFIISVGSEFVITLEDDTGTKSTVRVYGTNAENSILNPDLESGIYGDGGWSIRLPTIIPPFSSMVFVR